MKKKIKGLLVGVITVGALTTGISAATSQSPAQILAGLTNKSVDQVVQEKNSNGVTYGKMAKDANKLEEFKKLNFAAKKSLVDQKVKDGTMTKERADEIKKILDQREADCDGSASGPKDNERLGLQSGQKNGTGQGLRDGSGAGQGKRDGSGQRLRDGSGANR